MRAAEVRSQAWGPSLLLLMAVGCDNFPHKWLNQDLAAEAQGRSTCGRYARKPDTGRAAGAGRLNALLAPDVRALDVPYTIIFSRILLKKLSKKYYRRKEKIIFQKIVSLNKPCFPSATQLGPSRPRTRPL